MPILGLILGIVAVVLSSLSLQKKEDRRGMAIAGLVLGIIASVIGIVVLVLWIIAIVAIGTVASQFVI